MRKQQRKCMRLRTKIEVGRDDAFCTYYHKMADGTEQRCVIGGLLPLKIARTLRGINGPICKKEIRQALREAGICLDNAQTHPLGMSVLLEEMQVELHDSLFTRSNTFIINMSDFEFKARRLASRFKLKYTPPEVI